MSQLSLAPKDSSSLTFARGSPQPTGAQKAFPEPLAALDLPTISLLGSTPTVVIWWAISCLRCMGANAHCLRGCAMVGGLC